VQESCRGTAEKRIATGGEKTISFQTLSNTSTTIGREGQDVTADRGTWTQFVRSATGRGQLGEKDEITQNTVSRQKKFPRRFGRGGTHCTSPAAWSALPAGQKNKREKFRKNQQPKSKNRGGRQQTRRMGSTSKGKGAYGGFHKKRFPLEGLGLSVPACKQKTTRQRN